MSRQNKIIIYIAAILLGILAIVILLLSLGGRAPLFNENINGAEQNAAQNIPVTGGLGAVTAGEQPATADEAGVESALKAIAKTFAERFGSFSSESNYQNLADLKIMMTEKMQGWADNYIKQNPIDDEEFYGVTTRALNVEILNLSTDKDQGQVLVTTQREETRGKLNNPTIFYQKLLLILVRENKTWKVDWASWQ